ncbi:MAG: phage terminase small subunit-related protein [Bacteroidales bacterium]|nr:phage terminase small subunit-related protein [Bacteroidales bacterium]
MAKERERKTARILYVEQVKTAKDIAELLNVSEKTVSAWVNKYAWKSARTALITNKDNRIENIKQIIDGFAQIRLDLQNELNKLEKEKGNKKEINDIRQELARIDAGVANWNKTLENIDKNSKISLSEYLYVMDSIFDALRVFDTELYMKTITFQEKHINDISIKLG